MENSIYKFNYSIGSSIISLLYEFNENLILKNKDENNLLIKCGESIKKLNDLKEIKLRERNSNDIYVNGDFKFQIIELLSENKNFRIENKNYKLLRESNNKLILKVYYSINQNETTKEINNNQPTSSDISLSKIKKEKSIDSLNNNQQESNLILISDDNNSNESEDDDSNSEYNPNESENDDSSSKQSELSNFSKDGSNLTIRHNLPLNDRENQESNNQWKDYLLLPDEYKSIIDQIKSRFDFRKIHQNDLDLIFDIVKYLKHNFIIEKKDSKARPNFILKKCLYEEIESVINLRKSNFFGKPNLGYKLNAIIFFTFKNNPEFCNAHYRIRDSDGQNHQKAAYKNLKRKNSNDDISEDESISDEDKEWKKYKLSADEQLKIEKKIENHKRFNNISKLDKKITFDIIKYLRYNFIVEENNKESTYIIKEKLRNEIESAIGINKSNIFGNNGIYKRINLAYIINFAFNDNPKFVANITKSFNINGKICKKKIYKNLKRKFADDNLPEINDDIRNTSTEDDDNLPDINDDIWNTSTEDDDNLPDINDDIWNTSTEDDESNQQLDQKWKKYELPLDQFNEIKKKIIKYQALRKIDKEGLKTIFKIVKYLKYNFTVQVENKKRTFREDKIYHYIIKKNLYEEIESAINLNKSGLNKDAKLGVIICSVFNDNPKFCPATFRSQKDGEIQYIGIYKRLKRINHN